MVISFFGVPAGTFPIPVIKAVIKACFVKPVKDQQMQSLSLRKFFLLYTGVIPLLFFSFLVRQDWTPFYKMKIFAILFSMSCQLRE